jgi:uncharacterized protein (TIGR00297 family)
MAGRPLPAGEARRKAIHAGMGLFALALPFLSWWQAALCALAAFAFNLAVLPAIVGHRLVSERTGSGDRGVLLYPLVVLGMILLFPHRLELVALGWGVLAFGDSAAGVVGMKWGRSPLPWNPAKTWEGVAAYTVAGTLGGAALASWYGVVVVAQAGGVSGSLASQLAALLGMALLFAVLPVAAAALLESVPHGLDDNVLPPLVVPFAIEALGRGDLLAGAPGDLPRALAVSTACAVVAAASRLLRPGGIAVAWLLGVATWMAAGPRGFVLLLAFLLAGTAATFVGFGRKRAIGAAEGAGGRRGAAEIVGKGGVVLAFSLVSILLVALTSSASAGVHALPGWILAAILAAATADTWGTELGSLLGHRPVTLIPPRVVAPGTPGAVSLEGLAASFAGAALIAGIYVALAPGPLQGRLTVASAVAAGGFLAALAESLLPSLGPATHAGKNLGVTVLGPIFTYALLRGAGAGALP